MIKKRAFSVWVLALFLLASSTSVFATGVIDLPQTGQTKCYDSYGTEIACVGTGQDGEIQAGDAGPVPRFTDNGDGTISDNLSGLMWLKDLNCLQSNYPGVDNDLVAGDGAVTWQHSLDFVAGINTGAYSNCGAGYTDWRLPNINEFSTLFLYKSTATSLISFLIEAGFQNVSTIRHWSSTNKGAQALLYNSHDQTSSVKSAYHLIVPVRTINAPKIPKTGQISCYDSTGILISCTGTGQDGEVQSGVEWPTPRFANNGDGTINDNLTGLMWLKDANCMNSKYMWFDTDCSTGGAVTWQHAIDFVAGVNSGIYSNCSAGYADWRLPNVNEMMSLISYSNYDVPVGHPFSNIRSDYGHWTSTTNATIANAAYYKSLWNISSSSKALTCSNLGIHDVWPVRGGPYKNPDISMTPTSRIFESVPVNSSSTQTFTIMNTGTNNLYVDITISGANIDQFNLQNDNCSNIKISPTGTCTVDVVFSPTLAGAKSATLNISSNDPDNSIYTAPLSGIGTQYALTVSKTGTGSGIISAVGINCGADCSEFMNLGAIVTLTAISDQTSTFNGWSFGTGSAASCAGTGNCSFSINADSTLNVVFTLKSYAVTPSAGTNGSMSPNTPQTANYNTTPAFTVTPATGYHILSVTGCSGNLVGNTYTVAAVTADCTVTASFAINTYTVTPSPGANGSMTPATPQTANYNTTPAFTITPAIGYHINTVSGCGGTLSGNIYTTGQITDNCTVTASFAINTYTVTPSAGSNGSIGPDTSLTVNYNGTTTFIITPAIGYHINSVAGCGGSLSNNIYTTGQITGDCTVTASFVINTYTVTPSSGANGSITPATPQTVNYNTTPSFTITPATGYHITAVTGCGGSLSGSTFTTASITDNCTVTASFAINTYTVTPSAGANGSMSPSTPQTANYNTTTAFTIIPATGYHIDTVSGCNGTLSGNTFTTGPITGDCSVTVSFAINTYTITPSAGVNGSINSNTVQIVNHGSIVSFTVTPDTGYHIASVGGCNGNLSGNTFTTGPITGGCTVTTSFAINTYSVTPVAGANGSMTPANAQTANYGSTISFIVTPSTGYHIEAVSGCGGSLSVSTFTTGQITGDCTVTASFAINTYTVTPSAGANGSISCTPTIVNYGSSSTCDITPETGYHIVDVVVNGNSVGTMASYTIDNITADASITATFAINTYAITASSGSNGSVTCIPTTVNHGSSSACAITPVSGHHVADVLVDGSSVGAITEYSFNNVVVDHDISASFEINTYTVKPTAGDGGSISPNGNQTINHGSTVIFAVTPNIGHHIVSVSGCGGTLTGNTYTTGAVMGDCTVTANFAINTYVVTALSEANGSINPDAQIINHGSIASFTVTPATGYHIASVTGCNGTLSGNIYATGPIADACTVSATFAINTYTVTATAGADGSISCSPAVVNHGSSSECVITPDTGYHIVDVSVNGTSAGALESYTISNITADTTIIASFAINTYAITTGAGANGAITCTPNPVNHSSSATCSITPGSGYHTVNVIVDGKTMGAVTTYAFSNVTAAHAIEATFADNHRTAKLKVRIEDTFKERGKGKGIVTSSDGIINCNGKDRHRDDDDDCTYRYYENTVVVLTATAADRSVFAEWDGCDSVDGSTCIVTVSNYTKVEADFDSLDPEISVHPDSLHFGSTKPDRPEKRRVKIKNKGDAALVVSSLKVVGSADFTTNWVGQQTLGYKESYTLEVTFAPKSKGEKAATLRITCNDPDEPVVELQMSGSGNVKSR